MTLTPISVGSADNAEDGQLVNRELWQQINTSFTTLDDRTIRAGFFDSRYNHVGGSPNNTLNPAALAENTTGAYIGGGSTVGNGNHLGRVAPPNFAYNGESPAWESDTAYGALEGQLLANATNVSTIVAGYDHVCNQIAGFIGGGGHNFIKYHVGGHSCIVAGAFNLVSGARGFIGAGNRNWVDGDLSCVVHGTNNHVTANNSSVLNGMNNRNNGNSSSITGGNNVIMGTSGFGSLANGINIENNGPQSAMFGRQALWEGRYAVAVGGDRLAGVTNMQGVAAISEGTARTVDATLQAMTYRTLIRGTHNWVFTGHVYINGIDEDTGDVVAFAQAVTMKSMQGTGTFYKQTGDHTTQTNSATTPSLSSLMALDPFIDEIGVGQCELRLLSGSGATLLIRVVGKEATNISWTCATVGTWMRVIVPE